MTTLSTTHYTEFRQLMPRACIDLLIVDSSHHFLTIKRNKSDTQPGELWLPGGRIMIGETETETISRLLNSECGFGLEKVDSTTQLTTFSYFGTHPKGFTFHDVTTIFCLSLRASFKSHVKNSNPTFVFLPLDLKSADESISTDFKNYLSKISLLSNSSR